MKHLTRFLIPALCLILILSAAPVWAAGTTNPTETTGTVPATTVVRAPDQCGDTMTWKYADGVLTISGEGSMDDFAEGAAPWQAHSQQITQVVFKGNISYIGENAFRDYDTLTAVDFGSAIYEIGKHAFRSCDGLTSIQLPYSFKVFGESCFENCKSLTEIHCKGRFPSFRQNSLWNTHTVIYYPADNPWDLKYIDQLESAFRGRITFLASDGTDPHDALATTAATETQPQPTETAAATVTTVPVQTQPPETVPVSSATHPAATTAATVPPATDPAPSQEPDSRPNARQIVLVVTLSIAIVFTLLAVGILVSQEMRRRRKHRRRRNK